MEIFGTVEGIGRGGGWENWLGVVRFRIDVLAESRPGVCVGVDVDRRKFLCFGKGALAYGEGS
jgi:hypothetical protein